jgi:Protein of unknown function (DUF3300)
LIDEESHLVDARAVGLPQVLNDRMTEPTIVFLLRNSDAAKFKQLESTTRNPHSYHRRGLTKILWFVPGWRSLDFAMCTPKDSGWRRQEENPSPKGISITTMQKTLPRARPFGVFQGPLSLLCVFLVTLNSPVLYAQEPPAEAPLIPNDQLDSLVAPIALYPDPLLAQMLAASTYPLEIIQLQQWLQMHKDLKEKALVDAVEKEDWDPSVQAMAALPDAVKQLAENIKWTTDLGNAFLAQQSDVMDAVQRMRMKAQGAGNLKTTEQQKVETKVVENKTVVVIEQANPQIVYVPSYNPVVVYGPPVYPYPPIVYPPVGAYVAGAAIGFGVGIAIGAAWGGGWGYNAGWGGNNNITINNNNNFVNNSNRNTNIKGGNRNNINGGNRVNNGRVGGNNTWQHNAQHRGGTPYSNRATANKFGGTTRGASASTRQAGAGQNLGGGRQQAGNLNRASPSTRQQPAALNRAGGASARQPSAANRGGGADRIGNRSVPTSSARGGGAFNGGSGGFSGRSAQANSSRGASSMGSRGGGGRGGGRRR